MRFQKNENDTKTNKNMGLRKEFSTERQHGDRVQMRSQHNKRIRKIKQSPVNRLYTTVYGAFLHAKRLKNSHFYAILKKEKEIDKSGFVEVICNDNLRYLAGGFQLSGIPR